MRTIWTTGVGKSGIAARYLADCLATLGVRCVYLGSDSLGHGGCGVINKGDEVVIFTDSGKGQWLRNTEKCICGRGGKILYITSSNILDPAIRYTCQDDGSVIPSATIKQFKIARQLAKGFEAKLGKEKVREILFTTHPENRDAGTLGLYESRKASKILDAFERAGLQETPRLDKRGESACHEGF